MEADVLVCPELEDRRLVGTELNGIRRTLWVESFASMMKACLGGAGPCGKVMKFRAKPSLV